MVAWVSRPEPAQRELVGAHLHEQRHRLGHHLVQPAGADVGADPLDAADRRVGDGQRERGAAVEQGHLGEREAREVVEVGEHDPEADEVEAGDQPVAHGEQHERGGVLPRRADPQPRDLQVGAQVQRRRRLSHPGPPPCAWPARSTPWQAASRTTAHITWKPEGCHEVGRRCACRARCRRAPGRTTPTAAPARACRATRGTARGAASSR